jgi:uncharacterized membrane protein YoaK (UPF0700 family)
MLKLGGPLAVAALLSFNGGFVDTSGFLGLQGLFTAHVTGNFVTLGAALVLGHHGIIGKLIASRRWRCRTRYSASTLPICLRRH